MTTKAKGVKTIKAQETRKDEVILAVQGMNLETASKKIADTQLAIQKSLNEIGNSLSNSLLEKQRVDQAIEFKQQELKRLYSIEVAAETLDALEADYAIKKKQHEDDLEARKVQRQDEEEDWLYEWNKRKRVKEDELTQRESDMVAKISRMDKEAVERWNYREKLLKDQEDEVKVLRQDVAAFPVRLDAEVKKAVAAAVNQVEKDTKNRIDLLTNTAASREAVLNEQNSSLKFQCTRLETQIKNLEAELSKARADVLTISLKQAEVSSGKQALEALQQQQSREIPASTKVR